MSEEPPTKRAKTGWESHKLNCNEALMKADEGKHLKAIAKGSIELLAGIGPKKDDVLEHLKIHTVEQLATYKFYQIAKSIKTLAEVETKGGRLSDSVMNIDHAVDKKDETKSFKEMLSSPLHILEGLTKEAEDLFGKLGIHKVKDLADFKFSKWAEAITTLAAYEEELDEVERKKQRELQKLSD